MAKIEKIKKGTATIYPATIPQAVVDPTSGKSAREEFDEKANHGYDSSPKTLKQVENGTSVKMTNLVVNGGFESGIPSWSGSGQPILSEEEKLSGDSSGYMNVAKGTPYSIIDIVCDINDKLYFSVSRRFKSIENIGTSPIRVYDFGGLENGKDIAPFYNGNLDVWETTTAIVDGRANGIRLSVGFFSASTAQCFVDNMIAVNLTQTFGKGNEPTKEEFELLLATLGIDYFEGEITIPAQKVMQWQLKSASQLESEVEQLAYVKIKNEVVNGNFENGLTAPFSSNDGNGGASTLAINSSTPISGNYDIRFTIITPATGNARPILRGLEGAANIGDKIYLHFYAKILSGIPIISGIQNGAGVSSIYGGDVVNGRNTRIIDVAGTSINLGLIYFNSLSAWDMQMDNFIRINLTETFGAGNEPTEEEMNLLFSTLGTDYFEGEITISSQKIMQWQLALIRKNKNAIIALGGTII